MFAVDLLDNQTLLPIDPKWYTRLAKHVLREEGVKKAQVAVLFVDNEAIHAINKKHLKHDYPTDVITFPLSESTTKIDGQIVISTEFALESCEEYGWSATMEASLYLVHGILHLCGYDDRDEKSQAKMNARQEQLLEEFASQLNHTTQESSSETSAPSHAESSCPEEPPPNGSEDPPLETPLEPPSSSYPGGNSQTS